ncbi:carotenoid biosynthesis protein [Hymenobacter sp. BT186]|uniref:Carotenoid biosynthesis protein n=1 Tax=Hymenobacter telluris TaxID=2816474 RepID=A0A939JE83_9BACT|nr:carotenoid biosynthesis protein [Hymenobacter telluris]MBO0359698.1 carotenoid biosynthesis protein [Hymenobacter telluris]MBW3375725.1 carotenoid biosynthesis protein [Hymenobacter norwichensis]
MPDPTQQYSAPATEQAAAQKKRLRIAQGILLLFHVTGFVGLGFAEDPSFYLQFVPLNLLLTVGLLLSFQKERTPSFVWFCLVTMAVGFFVEVIGVRTGLLFGFYKYGPTLGVQWLGVPLMIGVNWLMLTYTTGVLAQYLPIPNFGRALVAALLMVGLDACLEPMAVRYDFWQWRFDVIPFQNFKGWFIVSLILQVFFNRSDFVKRNDLAPFVYMLQLIFFFGLGLLR